MKLLKTKKTKKKFYDKWTHKVSLLMYGSLVFRMADLDNLESWLDRDPEYRYLQEAINNKTTILELVETIRGYDKNLWKMRIERNQIDIYTSDIDIYDDISSKFINLIIQRSEPSEEIPLSDNNIVNTKKLPHDRFRYKVYLKPHKLSRDHEAKKKYIEWLDSQSSKISISHAVKQWFLITDWNWDRRYIWVEDEPTLLMLKLRNSDVCGKVYEYQLCDK